jgi:hypothetical protein
MKRLLFYSITVISFELAPGRVQPILLTGAVSPAAGTGEPVTDETRQKGREKSAVPEHFCKPLLYDSARPPMMEKQQPAPALPERGN